MRNFVNPGGQIVPTFSIAHHFGGGVYAKETFVRAGEVLVQHKHDHEHLSILAAGVVEVIVEGDRKVIQGPACLTIAAGKYHGVRALTDVAWYCIHATDCTDPEQVDEVIVAKDSDATAGMNEIVQTLKGA